ncbi:hybrid sensor histidine kinase/response regulator [Desulfobacterales bacterium HSG16]|nr:hybrid sensor histidine kinase/response regulator [Desulfobacterales bacterium HSG16]
MTEKANILIVDDNDVNIELLRDMVTVLGHTSIAAENGSIALEKMSKQPPDLVLLDIIMPKMSGYEVLFKMKDSGSPYYEDLHHIPVIMISAVDELKSVAKCIRIGAEDYLIKPFDPTLLTARIRACLEKKQMHDQEKKYKIQLQKEVRKKTRELSDAYKKLKILDQAKSDFLDLIAHELRTPLTGVFGAAEILFDDLADDKMRKKYQKIFEKSADRLLSIVDETILLTQIKLSGEMFSFMPNQIHIILKSAAELASDFAASRQVKIGKVPESEDLILCDGNLFAKAIASIIETAVKLSTKDNIIKLSCDNTENAFRIGIHTTGLTIPEKDIPKFFEVFPKRELHIAGGNIGLGPALAKSIIKLFDGSVTVENIEGASFTIEIPKTEKLHLNKKDGAYLLKSVKKGEDT